MSGHLVLPENLKSTTEMSLPAKDHNFCPGGRKQAADRTLYDQPEESRATIYKNEHYFKSQKHYWFLNDEGSDDAKDSCLGKSDPPVRNPAAIGHQLYVGNLDFWTTENDLKSFFRGYKVTSIEFPNLPRAKDPIVHAFVIISSLKEAARAVAELSGAKILDRNVCVRFACPQKPIKSQDQQQTQQEMEHRDYRNHSPTDDIKPALTNLHTNANLAIKPSITKIINRSEEMQRSMPIRTERPPSRGLNSLPKRKYENDSDDDWKERVPTRSKYADQLNRPREHNRDRDHDRDRSPTQRLFVRQNGGTLTEFFLLDTFSCFGKIIGVLVPNKPGTQTGRNFGFVKFADIKDAMQAWDAFFNDDELAVRYTYDTVPLREPLDIHKEEESDRRSYSRMLETTYREELAELRYMHDVRTDSQIPSGLLPTGEAAIGSAAAFIRAPNVQLYEGAEEFRGTIDYIIRLRNNIIVEYPNESPSQQTRRIVQGQMKWLEEHLLGLKQLRMHFPTTRELVSKFDDNLEKRSKRSLLISSLCQVCELLEQMIILHKIFPAIFPQTPDTILEKYMILRLIRKHIVSCFETTFSSLLNWDDIWTFLNFDINNVCKGVIGMKLELENAQVLI